MARKLHRVVEVGTFSPDEDYADTGNMPPWDPIELHPGCRQITWWVRPYDGEDPLTAAQVTAANATIDAELVFADGIDGGGFSRSAEITNLAPGTRVVDSVLPARSQVWVRISGLTIDACLATHFAVFWEET